MSNNQYLDVNFIADRTIIVISAIKLSETKWNDIFLYYV